MTVEEPGLLAKSIACLGLGTLFGVISISLIEGYYAPGYTRYCYDDPEYGDTCDNVVNDWSWVTTPAAILLLIVGAFLFYLWVDEQ